MYEKPIPILLKWTYEVKNLKNNNKKKACLAGT